MGLSENSEKMVLMGCPRSGSMTARAAAVSNGVMLSWSLDSSCMTGTGSTSGLRYPTPQACLHRIRLSHAIWDDYFISIILPEDCRFEMAM